jgi:hypothetical protein
VGSSSSCCAPCDASSDDAPGHEGRAHRVTGDEHLERLAGVHEAVPLGDVGQGNGSIEDSARLDAPLEHVRQGGLDVGAYGRGTTGQGGVLAEQRPEADRRCLVLWDAHAADDSAWSHDGVRLLVGGHVADGLEDDVAALAAGELHDLRHALRSALGDHVGRAELAAEVGAGLVAAHEDDPLGAHVPGGQDRGQADGSVTDHGHRGPGVDLAHVSRVVAGEVDVGQGQQGREQRLVDLARHDDQGSVGLWDADGLRLAAADATGAVPAAVHARVWNPSRQNTHVLSWNANGEMTKSPFVRVETALPVSSTTPRNSWPIGTPTAEVGRLWNGCRSDPQTQDRTTRTIASVGCWMVGSGTCSTRTSPAPYMNVARNCPPRTG